MCLKRKKLYEKEIAKYQGARLTLEQQIITLESATVNVETFRAMRAGASAMEQIHGQMSTENVDDVMDEISEQMQVADEISEAISNPIGGAMEDDVRCVCILLCVSPFGSQVTDRVFPLRDRTTCWRS